MFLWIIAAALAAETVFVSAELPTQDEAQLVASEAAEVGLTGEVVRTYLVGTGWRWVFRSLPADDGLVAELERRLGKRGFAGPLSSVSAQDWRSTDEVIRAVLRAHTGLDGQRWDPAGSVRFEFTRAIPGRGSFFHVYRRDGEDVELRIRDGSGTTLLQCGVVNGVPYTQTVAAEGVLVERVANLLRRFSPEVVIGIPMRLAAGDADALEEFDAMRPGGGLVREGRPGIAPMAILIDENTDRVAWVAVGERETLQRRRFQSWQNTRRGVSFPGEVITWRSDIEVERLEISMLSLDVGRRLMVDAIGDDE